MQLHCPHCGQICEAEQELAVGQHVVCPFCGVKFSYGVEEDSKHIQVKTSGVPHRQQIPSLFERESTMERPVSIKLVSLFYALGTVLTFWGLVNQILSHAFFASMLVNLLIAYFWCGITVFVWQGRMIGRWCVDGVSVLITVLLICLLINASLTVGLLVGCVVALYLACSVLCHLSSSTEWFGRPQMSLKQYWKRMSFVRRWMPVSVFGMLVLVMMFLSGPIGGRGWSVTLGKTIAGEREQKIVVYKQYTKGAFSDYGFMVKINEAEHVAEILLPDVNQDEKGQVKYARYVDSYKYELYRDKRWEDFVETIYNFTKYQTGKEVIEYVSKFR